MIASYKRISLSDGDLGIDGKDESNSIENQKSLIDEYIAARQEFEGVPVLEFVDDGYSGTNFDRPGFQGMMESVRRGEVDTIIVKDLSRFGRNYIGVGEYLEQIFPVLGVRFIAINNYYDSSKHIGTTMGLDVAVSNLVNTMYSRDVGKKLHSSNEVKWRKGYSTSGTTPFGYVFDPERKGRFAIDPEAARIVRRIFDLALLGLSTTEIAYQLNEEHVLIPSEYNRIHQIQGKSNTCVITPDKIWDTQKVRSILKTYEYTGALVLGKRRTVLSGTNVTTPVPRDKRYVTENAHTAIVTREEFIKAQDVIRSQNPKAAINQNYYALRSKIRCGHCHRAMLADFRMVEPVIFCREGREMPMQSQCSSETYLISDIENLVFHALRSFLLLMDGLNTDIRNQDKEKKRWQERLEREQAQAEQKLRMLKAEKMRLYEAYAGGSITLEEYQSQREELSHQITMIQEKLDSQPEAPVTEIPSEVRAVAREADTFLNEHRLTKNMAEAFIENVFIYENRRVEIRFRFEDVIKETLEKLSAEGGNKDEDDKNRTAANLERIASAGYVRCADN